MEHIKLYNDNCFEAFKKVEDNSVHLFLLDLPYGQTACKWDSVIDLEQMWKEIKRTLVKGGIVVMFCTTKFGFTLIQSNPKWFKYDLVWKKSKKVGFLSANKMPLRQHEMVYVFKDKQGTYNPQKTEGKPYKTKRVDSECEVYGTKRIPGENISGDRHPSSVIEKEPDHEMMYVFKEKQGTYNAQKTEGKPYDYAPVDSKSYGKEFNDCYYGKTPTKFKPVKNDGYRHPTSIVEQEPDHEMMYVFKDKQGTYNAQKTETDKDRKITRKVECENVYGELNLPTESSYKGKHPTSIVEQEPDHEMMYVFKDKQGTYNPQKTEGKPYKIKEGVRQSDVYDTDYKKTEIDNKGDRHPTSIVEQEPDHEMMYVFKDKQGTYNPQKIKDETQKRDWTKTKPKKCDGVYGKIVAAGAGVNEGDRHPTSIVDDITIDVENTVLDFKSVNKTVHKTQKPVDLCEWLIKSYSNEGDTVMDFCMGSGTAGVASKNTKRKFIGVEMDKEIFEVAKERIEKE